MNSRQIDAAMQDGTPVICDGRRYRRVVECVSWYDLRGVRRISAVLMSEQGNYTVRVPAEKVYAGKEDERDI